MKGQQEEDYRKVEKAIRYVQEHWQERPDLATIARQVHLSEFHFTRLFKRWAGTTPKQFLQYLTKEHAIKLLRQGHSVLAASHESGLSGPGRLHDLLVSCEALTPGEIKKGGQDVVIDYGFGDTPFGEALIAQTVKGICGLVFVGKGGRTRVLAELKKDRPKALWRQAPEKSRTLLNNLFSKTGTGKRNAFSLQLQGTNFQVQVWQALLKIPEGSLVSYQGIANLIGRPGAARAVGSAIGSNRIAVLIPCHRVIRENGMPGGYRWSAERKASLIAWESALSTCP